MKPFRVTQLSRCELKEKGWIVSVTENGNKGGEVWGGEFSLLSDALM